MALTSLVQLCRDTPTLLFFVSVGFWRITPDKNSFVVLQLFPTTAVLSQARAPPDLND